MEGEDGEEEENQGKEEEKYQETEVYEEDQGQEGGEISFHALKGGPTGKIIKVRGQVGKKKLMGLTDSGSTHNFLNEATTIELK